MNEYKLQTSLILLGCAIYFICLICTVSLAAISVSMEWYQIEGDENKKLFTYRGTTGSEITTTVFLFVGLCTTILECACLCILILRVFGWSCGKFAKNFLQFQMIFSCWTSFFWYMAVASFWILTPQRTGKHLEGEAYIIQSIHYDLNFRNKSHLTHPGQGFYYMCIALLLTFFSLITSVILETMVAPRSLEK